MNDKQLNEIIDAPRNMGMEVNRRFDAGDLLTYFDTMGGKYEPSWKFMDLARMTEIFERAKKANWFNENHRSLIHSTRICAKSH